MLGEHAHVFTRGLTLSHFDAVLNEREDAGRFLAGDVEGELAARGVEANRNERPGVARHSAREP